MEYITKVKQEENIIYCVSNRFSHRVSEFTVEPSQMLYQLLFTKKAYLTLLLNDDKLSFETETEKNEFLNDYESLMSDRESDYVVNDLEMVYKPVLQNVLFDDNQKNVEFMSIFSNPILLKKANK